MNTDITAELRERMVTQGGEVRPYALFSRIALDYGVSVTEVSRAWDALTAKPRGGGYSSMAHASGGPAVTWQDASPVADVLPQPGALTVLPMNAVLIQGRIKLAFSPVEMAWAVGMKRGDYMALEAGRMLPTEIQAARIAALINVPIRNVFVAAAGESFWTGRLKGLSALQLLRCRQRLAIKDMCNLPACAGVRAVFVNAIERGTVKLPLAPVDEMGLQKLAAFFGVSEETIMQQVPPAVFKQAAHNTAAFHDAIKVAAAKLPQVGMFTPEAIGDGGKKA